MTMIKDYGAILTKAIIGKPADGLEIYSATEVKEIAKKYGLSEMHSTNFNILNRIVFNQLCDAEQLG